jgi:hypothetical protein
MSAADVGFTPYRRPAFCVAAPTNLNFDIVMHAYGNCEIPVFNFSGIVTAEEWAAAQKPSCLLEDFIPVPSRDEPFNLSFRYISTRGTGKTRTIKASGDVVVVDESGATQPSDSQSFKMENGRGHAC